MFGPKQILCFTETAMNRLQNDNQGFNSVYMMLDLEREVLKNKLGNYLE